MVMTRGGQPDRHITPSQSQGPQATGQNYNAGNPNASMSTTSDAAAAVYGNPDAPDATRMDRMKNIAAEAIKSDGTTESYGPAFVEPTQDWTLTANKTVDENGLLPSVPAFPGDTQSDSAFSYLGQPPNQGKDIGVPVATKGAPSVNNSGSPQQTGRYGV
jgi:hypothetical protein